MKRKRHTALSGMLMCPLCVGSCAHILHEGRYLRTSQVVAIHCVDAREIRFETRNTCYRLLPEPVPQAAGYRFAEAAA